MWALLEQKVRVACSEMIALPSPVLYAGCLVATCVSEAGVGVARSHCLAKPGLLECDVFQDWYLGWDLRSIFPGTI
jgi:hypothetical protein